MPEPKITVRKDGDITTMEVIEYHPAKSELKFVRHMNVEGVTADARDICGDGTDEFLHNNPLARWNNFPVQYFIETSVPLPLVQGVIDSFEEFNKTAGFKFYERVTSVSNARIRVSFGVIDQAGGTLARATWSWNGQRILVNGTITFDSRDSWGVLANESCGATGSTFDIINVGVHEVGHLSGLAHAPTDELQTMFARTSPGKTLGRTLGNGDLKGFREAYDLSPPPPPPVNRPPVAESFTMTVMVNTTVPLNLRGSDPDNDPITFSITQQPQNGIINSGNNTYSPTREFVGTDSFKYVARDDKGAISNEATVSINVNGPPPPDCPPDRVWDEKLNRCILICPTGQKYDPETDTCIPIPPPPPPPDCIRPELPPRPSLAQIFEFIAKMFEYIRCVQGRVEAEEQQS